MPFCRVSSFATRVLLILSSLLLPVAHPALAWAAQDTHVVQAGETISTIATMLGVDPDALVTINGLQDPNHLSVGQLLQLPPGPPRYHEVQEGDTLSIIAAKYGLSVESLVAANQLEHPDQLRLGATLRLSGTVPAAAPSPTPAPPASSQGAGGSRPQAQPSSTPPSPPMRGAAVPYVVSAGDTLSRIAQSFETSVADLLAANPLADPNLLALGQIIQVPTKVHVHTVEEGETLAMIAARYSVDLGSIVDFNEGMANPDLIRVGESVAIPRVATVRRAPSTASGQALARAAEPEATPAPLMAATTSPPSPPPDPTPSPSATTLATTPAPTPVVSAEVPKPPAPTPVPAKAQAAQGPVDGSGGMAAVAMRLLGRPYVWGGSDESGFDCSGFVWYVAKRSGVTISRGLSGQFNAGAHPDRSQLKPGDIVFFQNTYMPGLSHNGIYVGDGKFVHAADEASGVAVSRLEDAYWASRYFGATRVGG